MADISLGQAIALGTRNTVKTENPFTGLNQAVQRKQQMDFAREGRKAKEEAERQKMGQQFDKLIGFNDGGFHPHYQEQAKDITKNGMLGIYEAKKKNDFTSANVIKGQTEAALADLKAQNDIHVKTLNSDKEGYILPKELKDAMNESYSTGNPKIKKLLKDHPEYALLITDQPDKKGYSFGGVKDLDIDSKYTPALNELKNFGLPTGKRVKIDNGSDMLEYKVDGRAIEEAANVMSQDPYLQKNLALKDPKRFATIARTLKENAAKSGVPVDAQAIEQATAATMIAEDLDKRSTYQRREEKWRPRSSNGPSIPSNSVFNFDTTNLNQAEHVMSKAGVKKGSGDIKFTEDQGGLPSISPPTVASGNVQDERGRSVYFDNVKLVYVPGKREWYASGTTKNGSTVKADAIKITPTTIGSIASVLKTPAPQLVEIMNQRTADAGYKDKVSFGSSATGYDKKTNSTVDMGKESKPTVSNKRKITGF